MSCKKFRENSCQKKVVVLAPGASDLSEGMVCLYQSDCREFEAQSLVDDDAARLDGRM